MYLPQYHCIPENDEFWGKGFTDWVTVKKAKPLFKGHNQPKVPLNENYYDLSQKESVQWQAKLAKEYGIDGFGIYHYWFNNEKNILTKPTEIIRDNKDIEINYFLAWDNYSWRRTWSNLPGNSWADTCESKDQQKGPATLLEYKLGTESDWLNHYNYVRTHFKEERYIKVENKPVFIIFYFDEKIAKMAEYWDKLAKDDGFNGMYFIFKRRDTGKVLLKTKEPNSVRVFNYEPMNSGFGCYSMIGRTLNLIKRKIGLNNLHYRRLDYDEIWHRLLENAENKFKSPNVLHGCFVEYDDSPRRGVKKGIIIEGSSPLKFGKYLQKLIDISNRQDKEFVFITAWNEWGEGACLEPNTLTKYDYLKEIKKIKD